MTKSRSRMLLTSAAAALLFALAAAPARADDLTDQVRTAAKYLNEGLAPPNGIINLGGDPKLPSATPAHTIPSQQEARAALMMPDPGTVSAGAALANAPAQPVMTTGAAPPAPSGPIGATLQTMPAKFSQRNDVLDRLPIMAWPLKLDDQQRQQIYQAVMAEQTQPAPDADHLAPASALSFPQTEAMHPLPATVRNIPALSHVSYVKAKDKIFLVRPDTATVVDEITAS